MSGFASLPAAPRYRLTDATVPACLVAGAALAPDAAGWPGWTWTIDGGIPGRHSPAGASDPEGAALPGWNLDRGMVWPAFVEAHTHSTRAISAAHAEPGWQLRRGAGRGAGRQRWRIGRPMTSAPPLDFSLRCAFAHARGWSAPHIDSSPPQHRISWPVFAAICRAGPGGSSCRASP